MEILAYSTLLTWIGTFIFFIISLVILHFYSDTQKAVKASKIIDIVVLSLLLSIAFVTFGGMIFR